MCIEHPDHTGSSSNPLAPWNQPDTIRLTCDVCEGEYEADADHEAGDECEGRTPEGQPCFGTLRPDWEYDSEPDWDSMPGGADDY